MFRVKRTYLTTALLTLATFAAGAVSVQNDPVALAKEEMVDKALQTGLTGPSVRILNQATQRANALLEVLVDSATPEPTVRLRLSTPAVCDVVSAFDGSKITLNLYDTIVVPNLKTMSIDGGNAIAGVNASLESIEPQFVTKVEIDLLEPATHRIVRTGSDIILVLTPFTNDERQTRRIARQQMTRWQAAPRVALSTLEEIVRRNHPRVESARLRCEMLLAQTFDAMRDAKMDLLEAELAQVYASDSFDGNETAPLRRKLYAQDDRMRDTVESLYDVLSNLKSTRQEAIGRLNEIAGLIAKRLETTGLATIDPTELANISLEDRETIDTIMNGAVSEEDYVLQHLAAFARTLTRQIESADLLLARAQQQRAFVVAKATGTMDGSSLEHLDAQFAAIRTAPLPQSRTVQARLIRQPRAVRTQPLALDLQPVARAAVLVKEDTNSIFEVAAPTKRTRPSYNSLSASLIENPRKMAILSTDPANLAAAERAGMIVLAQQQDTGTGLSDAGPAKPVARRTSSAYEPRTLLVPKSVGSRPQFSLYTPGLAPEDDPLQQLVNIDFRDMDLTNVVALLAQKGGINVIAGAEVSGSVTANLKNIPLGRAIEIVLRMNGLGILEEAGVYRITTYEEAVATRRETTMVFLKNAQAVDVKETLEDITNADPSGLIAISANAATNTIIVSGPRDAVQQLEVVIRELDVAEPVIPTLTVPIKLNYSEPLSLIPVISPLLSDQGEVTADVRSRHIIVTDIPIKVEEIQELLASLDLPVKQVNIEAMIVDAELNDDAETGVSWLLDSISRVRDTVTGETTVETDALGITTSEFEGVVVQGAPRVGALVDLLPTNFGSALAFNVLSGDIDLSVLIAAEVRSNNAELIANPSIVTVENQPAIINITSEFPYQELTSTDMGGQIVSTEFKEIGTILEVTPRVTHDNPIIAKIDAKQRIIIGTSTTGVPIEAKRQAQTTLRLADGQTIFIGGLRSFEDRFTVRKTPILGDIPILNFFFSSKQSQQVNVELLIFLTCSVIPEDIPGLTPYEKTRFDKLGGTPQKVDSTRAVMHSYVHPEDMRDPFYKWRRAK